MNSTATSQAPPAAAPDSASGGNSGIPAAHTQDATKVFGSGETEVTALNQVNAEFARGSFTAVMGPSGSGKSTLMHCLAGLESLTSGAAYIGETNIQELSEKQLTLLRRDKIGFIFQAFNLVPTLNARENMTLPMDLAGRKPDEAWFKEVVDTVGLGDRLSHRPAQLSGGQQQRVAVARALSSQPDIIFADEPTGNLDSNSGGEILQFLRRAVDTFEQTIVMVTHDAHAASYSDRVIFLSDGQIVHEMPNPDYDKIIDAMKHLGEQL